MWRWLLAAEGWRWRLHERWEGVESPAAYYCRRSSLTLLFLHGSYVFFGSLSHTLVVYHIVRGGMPLHDAVGETVKMAQLLISRRSCLVYGLRGVCWIIDLTRLPIFDGERSWHIMDKSAQSSIAGFFLFGCTSCFYLLINAYWALQCRGQSSKNQDEK